MLISLDWLKEFTDIPHDITPQKLAEDLTVHTVEVEDVIDQASAYNSMVVGEIVEIRTHENADKLKLCITNIGEPEPVQIVCGGKNVYEGMKVAVALPGAKVKWHGEGDLVELAETKIRGEQSFGMICAAAEIGRTDDLPTDEPYVMDLKIDDPVGTSLAQAFGANDVIIDIDNKSITNRPDLWGHYGIAREVSAMYGTSLKPLPDYNRVQSQQPAYDVVIEDKALCARFMVARMDNVTVGSSPQWMQDRLVAAGMRPINTLVDISNYVMLELGQPNHVFDVEKLKKQIAKNKSEESLHFEIRNAREGEVIRTIDDVERKLDPSMLVVTNGDTPLAIAGVMGGGDSEVDEHTTSIAIEVANFDAVSVRKTSQKLGLRTEASARFEKGLDPVLVDHTRARIIELITECIPEATLVGITDVGEWHVADTVITTSYAFIRERIGADISDNIIQRILERLGFVVGAHEDTLTITVPSWRATGDILIPEDIVEEVARMYGYDRIESHIPFTHTFGDEQTNVPIERDRTVKRILAYGAGINEVENRVFAHEKITTLFGTNPEEDLVKIKNPLSQDQAYVRRHLIPGLLQNVRDNARFANDIRLFEIGRIFQRMPSDIFKTGHDSVHPLPEQAYRLGVVLTNDTQTKEELFYDIKGVVDMVFGEINVPYAFAVESAHQWMEQGYELGIKGTHDDQPVVLGECGIISSIIQQKLKLQYPVAVLYIDYELVSQIPPVPVLYTPAPEYPAVTRDIAIVVNAHVPYGDLTHTIESASELLVSTELFDMYTGAQVGAGKKSLAWHLAFRHPEKTLTSEEADVEMKNITNALAETFGAELRS